MISRGGCPALSVLPAKTCSKCGELKPHEAFYRSSVSRDGRQWWCKGCMSPQTLKPKLCLSCQAGFVPPNGKVGFCSEECRRAGRYASIARYRSSEKGRAREAAAYTPRRLPKPCLTCGVSTLNPKFCSEECVSPPRVCSRCGEEFRRRGPGDRCSPCNVAARLERRPVPKPRVKRFVKTPYSMRIRQRPVTRSFVAGSCPMCGEPFVALAGTNPRFCSALCTKRAGRDLYTRRLRSAEKSERVFRRKVFERDNWTCRLCLKPVDRDAVVPAPLAPTVDHILPLSLTGPHVYANVQTAHFICNSAKAQNVTQLSFAA
jgi:hypothetical protein